MKLRKSKKRLEARQSGMALTHKSPRVNAAAYRMPGSNKKT